MSFVPFVCCLLVGLIVANQARTIQHPPLSFSIPAQTGLFVLPREICPPTCKLGIISIKDDYYGPADNSCVACSVRSGYCSCLGGKVPDSGSCPRDQASWRTMEQNAMDKAFDDAIAAGETSFGYVPAYSPFAIAPEVCPCRLGDNIIDPTFFGAHDKQCVRCHQCSCESGPLRDSCPVNDDEWADYVRELNQQAMDKAKAKAIQDLKEKYGDDITINDA